LDCARRRWPLHDGNIGDLTASSIPNISIFKKNIVSDTLFTRETPDPTRINLSGAWELQYWCKRFRVSEKRLREAVKAVGVMAVAVRAYLEQSENI
jgi:hypothetical protein